MVRLNTLLLSFVAALLSVPFVYAQSWNLPGDGSWNTASNWNPATVPNAIGAAVTFNGAATGQTAARTITLDAKQTVGSIIFNNDVNFANSITTGTGSPPNLIFNNGGAGATITSTGTGTGNNSLTGSFRMDDNLTAFVNNVSASSAAGSVNITGTVTGTGGFTKDGLGLATFGSNSKTYTGATVINNGRMRISSAAAPTATSSFTINAGGQVDLISGATYNFGSGPLNLNGAGPTSGPYAPFPGAIRPDTNLAITIGNAVNLQSTSTIHMQGSATGAITFSNAVTGAGGFIAGSSVHNADVGQIVFNGTDGYTGGTTVNVGTLVAGASSSTAFGTGNVSVLSASGSGGGQGKLQILAGATNAIADTATLSLAGGNVGATADDGFVDLGAGINETVGGLILGGVTQTIAGTYGSTLSGATIQNDEYFSGTGVITLAAPSSIPGDYNHNGTVDAADYALWRKAPADNGGAGGYTTWRTNFGKPPGSGSGLGLGNSAVPEPATLLLAAPCLAYFLAALCRRKEQK